MHAKMTLTEMLDTLRGQIDYHEALYRKPG